MKGLRSLLLLPAVMVWSCSGAQTRELVAEVNGRPIYLADYKEQLERNWMVKADNLKQLDYRLKFKCLEDMITQELILQESRRIGVWVSEQEVDDEIKRAVDPASPEFKKSLEDSGMTEQKWAAQVRNDLLIRKTTETALAYQYAVSEGEIKHYYEAHRPDLVAPDQFKVRQIVVTGEQTGRDLLDQLGKGADFAELARKFSQGPEAEKGGDLGWVDPGQMPVALQDQVLKLGPGQISGLVQSAYGFHILKLESVKKSGQMTLEDARAQILKTLSDQKKSALFQTWRRGLWVRNRDRIKKNLQVL
jgi:parvulin-like peptidyl-prolyl isomerase